jgi:hypothetical protein
MREGRSPVAVSSYGGNEDQKIRRQQKNSGLFIYIPFTYSLHCQKIIYSSYSEMFTNNDGAFFSDIFSRFIHVLYTMYKYIHK